MIRFLAFKCCLCIFLTVSTANGFSFPRGPAFVSECPDIHIGSTKDVYFPYETIVINYEIVNDGDTAFATISSSFGGYFIIHNQDGVEYINTLFDDFWYLPDTLQPGQKMSGHEIIEERYNVLFPGVYTCFLKINRELFYPSCDTFVYSDTILLTIVEPAGIEKEAYRLYLRADSLHWNRERDRGKWRQAFETYLHLAEKYPRTVYADKALINATLLADVAEDTSVVIDACKKLIEHYPDSPYFEWAFGDIYMIHKRLGILSEAGDYFNYLVRQYPGSRISDKARYWIERMQEDDF